LTVARRLDSERLAVTVVDRVDHHLFQPLLYQVATGLLSPGQIAVPIRAVVARRTRVVLGEVAGFDLDRQVVLVKCQSEIEEIGYDWLVVATGSVTSYFGHEDWGESTLAAKSLADADRIRDRVFAALNTAASGHNRPDVSTFLVLGAGPTGVEIAGQLATLLKEASQQLVGCDGINWRVILADPADSVLTSFQERLRHYAARQLEQMGVELKLGFQAEGIDGPTVTLVARRGNSTEVEKVDSQTVIWAAGVRASPVGALLADQLAGLAVEADGRVPVDQDARVQPGGNIFVIGDLASRGLPGLAEPAIQAGRHVARIIEAEALGRRPPRRFHYLDLGTIATIGPDSAIAALGRIGIAGPVAKLAWAFVHLAFLVGWGNRLGVLARWLTFLFGHRRPERISVRDHTVRISDE
jgi:NADH dehydrogenase